MKKTLFLIIILCCVSVMAKDFMYPEFYTDKNRSFSFIPPFGWKMSDEFPDDVRSKVMFTHQDEKTGSEVAFVILGYYVDQPRTLSSLKGYLKERLSALSRQKPTAIISPIEEVTVAGSICLKTEILSDQFKSMTITGYLENNLCLTMSYTAPSSVYYDYYKGIMESVQTFIALDAKTDKNKLVIAQRQVLKKKQAGFAVSEKKYQEALDTLADVSVDDEEVEFLRGMAYQGLNEEDRALECFVKASVLKPSFWEAFFQQGVLYTHKDENEKALESFIKADSLNPDSVEIKTNLAVIYRKTKDYNNAIKIYERLLKVSPGNLVLLFNLARTYSDFGKYKKAIKLYRRCIEINPDDPSSLTNLSACYFARKDYASAREFALRALAVDGSLEKAEKILDDIKKIEPK